MDSILPCSYLLIGSQQNNHVSDSPGLVDFAARQVDSLILSFSDG